MEGRKEILRCGEFVMEEVHDEAVDWLVVRSAAGAWEMRYRQDSDMYGMLKQLHDVEGFGDYFESFARMCFLMAGMLPSLEDMEGFYEWWTKILERKMADVEIPDDGEADKALSEERRRVEMEEEVARLLKEKGDLPS